MIKTKRDKKNTMGNILQTADKVIEQLSAHFQY